MNTKKTSNSKMNSPKNTILALLCLVCLSGPCSVWGQTTYPGTVVGYYIAWKWKNSIFMKCEPNSSGTSYSIGSSTGSISDVTNFNPETMIWEVVSDGTYDTEYPSYGPYYLRLRSNPNVYLANNSGTATIVMTTGSFPTGSYLYKFYVFDEKAGAATGQPPKGQNALRYTSAWACNGNMNSDGVGNFFSVAITHTSGTSNYADFSGSQYLSNGTYMFHKSDPAFSPSYDRYEVTGGSGDYLLESGDAVIYYDQCGHSLINTVPSDATFGVTWSISDNIKSFASIRQDASGNGVLDVTGTLPDGITIGSITMNVTTNAPYAECFTVPSVTKNVYFLKTWREVVTTQPAGYSENGDNVTISSNEGLAWLISKVNGANGQTANDFSGKTVTLTEDVDMSAHIWVPVGTDDHPFSGTFDGGGHNITGLTNKSGDTPFGETGLFGYVDGGTVTNTFVTADLKATGSEECYLGIICNTLSGGTVSCCEAAGTLNASACTNLIAMGGLVGLASDNATVHSSFSVATLIGCNMGGAIGELQAGSALRNAFTNNAYNSTNNAAGLVYKYQGTLNNCYVRVRSGQEPANMFVTDKSIGSTIGNDVYYPTGETSEFGQAYSAAVTPYMYQHNDNLVGSASMLSVLNSGRTTGDAEWMRTTAGPGNGNSINDDYPIFKYEGFNAVASHDGNVLDYGDINDLLGAYTTSTDAIDLYRSKAGVTFPSSTSAKLYINEDVALTHASGTMNAFVGITLDNSAGAAGADPNGLMGEGLTDAIDWHMFSSPLTNAPLGINYTDNTQHAFSWNESSTPHYSFYPESSQNGYFPSKTYGTNGSDGTDYYTEWDFYTYYEPDYHWINFKRNSNSHWHEDVPYYGDPSNPADHAQIVYSNESNLTPGKGYLLASKEETFLQAYGNLNNEKVSVSLSYSAPQETKCQGYNLIGNPYQSYLDFDQFVSENSASGITSYVILDEDKGGYVSYAATGSKNDDMADRYINMHQGFFVVAPSAGKSVTFNPATMRSVDPNGASFRGSQPAYPLVNLIVKSENGSSDRVTVELDRPDNGGAIKMKQLKSGNGCLYVHHDDQDYSIIFMPTGTTSAAVRFVADEDGEFTLTWNTQNGTFDNLHLIDNIAGVDIDMNASSEYRFSANTKDYASRFKLMFTYTDVEENEEDASTGSASFAFQSGSNLVVNGEGRLEVIDMNGRVLSTTDLCGVQNTIALPNASQGLYMLRLTSGNGVRVQKIVVR